MAVFGFRLKTVVTRSAFMDDAELFERICHERFTAGAPELMVHGFGTLIAFPAIDGTRQIWIMMQGRHKIIVQQNEMAGLAGRDDPEALGAASDTSCPPQDAPDASLDRLLDITAAELEALRL